jgi:hypothetical protein
MSDRKHTIIISILKKNKFIANSMKHQIVREERKDKQKI